SAVGQNIPHDSAVGHVSGQSVFIDDMPPDRNEVLVDFVGSPVARGIVKRIDASAARKAPGVVAIFTADDVPGHNMIGPIIKDERFLIEIGAEAEFLGAPIVLIAAETREALSAAKKLVEIDVDALEPIFTIEQAIEKQQFIGPKRTIARGDARGALDR